MAADRPTDLDARVTELELLLTHLQRAVQDLNEVVVDHDRWRQETNRRCDSLQRQIEALREEGGEE